MVNREMSREYVALDLETTGVNPERDAIIEVGAVRFEGRRVLETFQTLVNPYRDLPQAIQRLTGIAQRNLNRAPSFAAVAGELRDFVGSLPVVGHHISFDLSFLARHGLPLDNEVYDTWDLASILLPYFRSYSLSRLAAELGAEHTRPHRALSDAQATHEVFVGMMERANGLDPGISAHIQLLCSRARWPAEHLFRVPPSQTLRQDSDVGLTGLNMEALGARLNRARRAVRPSKRMRPVNGAELSSYLEPGGLFSRSFPDFEHRPEQVQMMTAVAAAINDGHHIIVEGGTGVGKSVAYLLPAILYSMMHGARVVVSTNTINLQEQLLHKDIPGVVRVLEEEGIIPAGEFEAAPLKGRANYLCLRRWSHLARGEGLSKDDARLLSKTMVWLQDTCTGDRGEINLSGKDVATWGRVSAAEKGQCPGLRGDGVCFLRAARDRAEGAHMIVVNHALLLSDLALGGGLLPEYQHLIIDEAHHLEEGATQQLGFQIAQNRLDDGLDSLDRLLLDVRVLLRGSLASGIQSQLGGELIADLERQWSRRVKNDWSRLWSTAERFLSEQRQGDGDHLQLRITRATRAQPRWSELEMTWENLDINLAEGLRQIGRLVNLLETVPSGGPMDLSALSLELSTWQDGMEELRDRLKTLVAGPVDEERIAWMATVDDGRSSGGSGSNLALHSAPLNVGPEMDARLFSRKSSVIVTSATLSTQNSFDYIRQRIGLAKSEEQLVGSPFDYRRAALLLIAEDAPMPNAWGYQQAMEKFLEALGKALGGHSLVLFTAHSALRSVAQTLRGPLEAEGIRVLAQGIDGSPARILENFAENPRAVILGTSSFWEGVDVSGGTLKALVLARLPFRVPSEPVFAARSDQYEDPFYQYALPQAVLRFRQGIGRLIRSSRDRGTIVVLDKRIIARPYGKAFLDSIPPCTVKCAPLAAIPGFATDWIGNGI